MNGTSALMIFDEDDCVVRATLKWSEFYRHESCGKCTPCREGTYWYVGIYERLEHGDGTEEDLDTLLDLSDNILGRSFCALGDGATSPVSTSSIKYFRDEYLAHVEGNGCPFVTATASWQEPTHDIDPKAPPKEDLVTVTLDGIEISVPKGTLLIRVAEQLGISIPRFCDHPLLDPAGACRQCLVEVTDMGNGRGMPKPAASCTTTVMPGMVIKTQLTSVVADKAQQGVMELLLINHPLDCPICDKGGECPLQNQAMSNGRAESRFHEAKRTFPKPVAISSNVLLDRERCVLCQRCTRFSLQIAGDPFIDLLERGAHQQIGTSDEQCRSSPTSRATRCRSARSARSPARPTASARARSTCCPPTRSASTARRAARSAPTGAAPRSPAASPVSDPEVNEEWNCDKGRWAFHYADAGRPPAHPAGP